MHLPMSNSLSDAGLVATSVLTETAATAPAGGAGAAPAIPGVLIPLMAVGFVALGIWLVRRLANHEKLWLTGVPGRPNSLSPAHVILLMILWLLALSAVGQLPSLQWRLAGQVGVQVLFLGANLIVAALTFRHGLRRGLGLRMGHWLFDTGRGVIGYLAVLPLCLLTLLASVWALNAFTDIELRRHPLLESMRSLSPGWTVVAVVSGVVLAAVGEEVFFRGLVQSMIRQWTGRPWAAVLVTSAVFAMVHMANPQNVPAIFVLSLCLGYNYERCGRLYPSILIHAIFNGVFMYVDVTCG
jgi:membrane protease YdiL (CAAX protease family)